MADANVLRTIFTYPASGTGPYTIAFDYLARKFVQVTLIGPDRKLLVLNTDYRFSSTKQITLMAPPPAGYTLVEIRRYTDARDRLVDFQDGSILRATDLNVSQVQTMHIAEEGRDVASNTLGVDSDGNLDARGRKMVNLVDGVNVGDAVTVRQMKSWSESALNQAGIAKQQADAAAGSASATKTSETNSKNSETNSKNSENLAKDWASKPQGQLVDATRYSSLHYSLNSESSANASQGSATAASGSASAAKTSETNSASSASAASDSAATAKTEADRAKTEADKLGNMNGFASSIKGVNTTNFSVAMKGDFWADGGFRYNNNYTSAISNPGVGFISLGTSSFRPSAAQVQSAPGFNSGILYTDDNSKAQTDLFEQWSDGQFKTVLRSSVMAADGSLIGAQGRLELFRSGLLRNSGNFESGGQIMARGDASNVNVGSFLNAPGLISQLNWQGNYRNASVIYNQEYVGNYQSMFFDVKRNGATTTWSMREGGGIFTPQGQVAVQGSDVRLKTNIMPAKAGAGERLDQIGIVEYDWIGSGRRERGWIAQQVELVDELYTYQNGPINPQKGGPDLMNVSQNSLIADLILEVQSLRLRVKELESK